MYKFYLIILHPYYSLYNMCLNNPDIISMVMTIGTINLIIIFFFFCEFINLLTLHRKKLFVMSNMEKKKYINEVLLKTFLFQQIKEKKRMYKIYLSMLHLYCVLYNMSLNNPDIISMAVTIGAIDFNFL